MKKIGVLTSGGDAPGMNAAVRAVVRTAIYKKLEVIGFLDGFSGLIKADFQELELSSVGGMVDRGGTFLGTARVPEFTTLSGQNKAAETINRLGIDALIVIGGNGSLTGAHIFSKYSIPTIGIPASIDNDVFGSDYCIGFDTAANTAVDAISKIRDTASSHDRVFLVQVMGRNSGMIALSVALAGGGDSVIIPERPWTIEEICKNIKYGQKRGKKHNLIVVAEGVGNINEIATQIKYHNNLDVRVTVLGHIQRGGAPTVFDRNLASRLGYEAVIALKAKESDKMVGLSGRETKLVDLEEVALNKPELDDKIYQLVKILSL